MEFDTGTLSWVHGEIHASLTQALGHIETYAKDAGARDELKFARTFIHQAAGAVRMVGLEGVANLCDQSEQLLGFIAARDVAMPEAANIAARALAGADAYLAALLAGEMRGELSLLPLYRDVMGARGAEKISEADLFHPALDARAPKEAGHAPLPEHLLPGHVRQARARFQRGLLGWLRNADDAASLAMMRAAVEQVRRAVPGATARTFWWAASALMDAVAAGAVDTSVNLKQLMARIDLQMRRVVEGSSKVAERLLKESLYFLAVAGEAGERVEEVKRAFQLADLLPADNPRADELAGMQPLLRELRQQLDLAKEQWLRVGAGQLDALPAYTQAFDSFVERLAALRNTPLDALAAHMRASAREITNLDAARREHLTLETATALLLLENSVENYANVGGELLAQCEMLIQRMQAAARGEDLSALPAVPLLDDMSRRAQERMLLAQVGLEIDANLKELEAALDGYFRHPETPPEVAALTPPLDQIRGALAMLDLPDAARVLGAARDAILGFGASGYQANPDDFGLVADTLSSLGLYLEGLRHGKDNPNPAVLAPVLRRLSGEPEAPEPAADQEPEDFRADLIETTLPREQAETIEALDSWREQPEAGDARARVVERLAGLAVDADLSGDRALHDAAEQALSLAQASFEPDSLVVRAVQAVAPAAPAAPDPDTARLLQASPIEVDAELLEVFIEEAGEVLSAIGARLDALHRAAHDEVALTDIRRGFHTLKGSGRMVGLNDFGEAAWSVEQLLNTWLADARAATPDLLELLGAARADFSGWVDSLIRGEAHSETVTLAARADAMRLGEPAHAAELPIAEMPITEASVEATPALSVVEAPVPPVAQATLGVAVETTLASPIEASIEYARSEPVHEDLAPVIEARIEYACPTSAPEASPPVQPLVRPIEASIEYARPIEVASIVPIEAVIEVCAAPEVAPEPEYVNLGETQIPTGLFQVFIEEAERLLAAMPAQVPAPGTPTGEPLLRQVHTLAGIAATAGVAPLAELGHALERMLGRHPQRALDAAGYALLGQALQALTDMLYRVRELRMPEPLPALREALLSWDFAATRVLEAARAETATPAAAPVLAEIRVSDDLDADLLPIFLEEARELLPKLHGQLRAWRANPADAAAAPELLRALHTLKGGARMAGAMRLGERVHELESRTAEVLEHHADPHALLELLTTELDQVDAEVEALLHPAPAPTATAEATQEGATQDGAARQEPARSMAAFASSAAEGERSVRVRAETLDQLANDAGEIAIARSRIEGEVLGFRHAVADLAENVRRLRHQLREVEIQAESQMQATLTHLSSEQSHFDPLEFDRFTRFQELTRMLAESVHDVATLQGSLAGSMDEADRALSHQSRHNRQLQQNLLKLRMLPVASLAERLHRTVRTAARDLSRRAQLDIVGGDIELDRSVLERMIGPMEHLLRNAIAHGIETPEARAAAGKDPYGQITLSAAQEANEVRLSFRDDGAGLDLGRIRTHAIERGLLDAAEDVDDERLTRLIFEPGFSTADIVTEVAGRGVGMDVVRNEVAALGGRIEVASEPGRGASFNVYLPLTLALTQVVMVRAGEERYALPSNLVRQVRELKLDALEAARAAGAIEWQGESYPLRSLNRMVGVAEDIAPQRYNRVILMGSGARRVALWVEHLAGNREVVVKNIGPQLARVPGVAGATVSQEGRAVLILNPVLLPGLEQASALPEAIRAEAPGTPLVLVVDDSLTVRKITSRLLERAGYRVATAKDGMDALERMQEEMPAVALVDIEMPRMDGFELTRAMRGDAAMKSIPIVMITSRLADKHRDHAMALGVNVYLGKPFNEEELLAHLAVFTGWGAREAA
jgi:chemosensory pili system protein ChpA (sensor histidine kinase/response regulator)